MDRPRLDRVHVVVASVVLGAAITTPVLTRLPGTTRTGPVAAVAVLAAVTVVAQLVPFLLPRGEEAEEVVLDEAVVAIALLCLPPGGVLLVLVGASVAAHGLRRRSPLKALFNVAGHLLGTTAALAAQTAVVAGAPELSPRWVLGAVLGIAAYWVIVSAAVWWVVAVASGQPVVTLVRRSAPWGALTAVLGASGGIGVGVAVTSVGWLGGLVAAAPLLLLQRLQAAQRDQRRLAGLLRLATTTADAREASIIERAVERATADVLGVDGVEVRPMAPVSPERGALIGEAGPWLVVPPHHRLGASTAPADGAVLEAVASVGRVALNRAALLERLEREAQTDALTGLPNRTSFSAETQRLIVGRSSTVTVLVVDLDRFKRVNDSLGHLIGDELLVQVARRLAQAVADSATVARMGGDEFTVVAAGVDGCELASRVLESFDAPFRVAHHELFVTTSIGLAEFPRDGDTPTSLLRAADRALYRAKAEGRNTYRAHDGATHDLDTVLELEHDLYVAVAEEELDVAFQPIVTGDGRVVGAEALVRWDHPLRGPVPPDRFLPIAEEAGLIAAIDAWVMDRAVAQLGAWRSAGFPDLRMAVNVSARTLSRPMFAVDTMRCLERHHVDPGRLEIEITEQTAALEPDAVIDRLRLLRRRGVSVAVDDFGVGYSSLSRLYTFPVDRLKIDRSFVSTLRAGQDGSIVPPIVALAHALHLQVTAEGVETEEQRQTLVDLACDDFQGWLFSRALSAGDFLAFLGADRVGVGLRA